MCECIFIGVSMHVHMFVCIYVYITHTRIYICKFATLNKMRHFEVERIKLYILVKRSPVIFAFLQL